MKLTDTQFARTAAFIAGLHLINSAIGADQPLNTETVQRLQDLTVERSNQLAVELGVNFPDETEREIFAPMPDTSMELREDDFDCELPDADLREALAE